MNVIPKPSLLRVAGIVALALAALWVAMGTRSCTFRHKEAAAVEHADQSHQEAQHEADQAVAQDAQIEPLRRRIEDDAATVAALRRQVERLRTARPGPAPTPVPPGGSPVPPPIPADRPVALDVAKDQLIAAQDRQIQDQALTIHTLTLARDSWKSSATASAHESVQLRSALAAQEGLARAERWRGRVEGFVVGVAVGYAGGKL